jgi:hypothetical protein
LVCVVWQGNKKNWGGSFLGVFLKRLFWVVHLLYLPAQGSSTSCFVYTTILFGVICPSTVFLQMGEKVDPLSTFFQAFLSARQKCSGG